MWTGERSKRLPANWAAIRRTVLARDSRECQLRWKGCTVTATEVDHRVHGDNHALENLQAVCSACHKKKTNREATEARNRMRAKRKALRYRPAERHPGLM